MEQAEWDLGHALHDSEYGFYNGICFSAQQAAEKALKAVFQKKGAIVYGHSVAEHLRELQKRFIIPEDSVESAMELDQAYIPRRYPDALPVGTPKGFSREDKPGG